MPLAITAEASDQDKHVGEVYAVIFHNDKLYSAAADGKIKVWDANLQLEAEFQAHESAIYHIAAKDNIIYSCSNDGTIQAWNLDTFKHVKTLFESSEEETLRLYVIGGKLYSGNDKGMLSVWEDDAMLHQFNMLEEIRDFTVIDTFIYTVRDRDVCIAEIIPGDKARYMTRMTLEGRSPLCVIGNKMCFATRFGNNICVHDNTKANNFKKLGELQGHEMIANALCGFEDSTLFSGAYDETVKQWNLGTMKCVSTCEVGFCANSICIGSQGHVYVAGDNGFIKRLDNK